MNIVKKVTLASMLLVFCSAGCLAQGGQPVSNDLSGFVGTWEYRSDTELFQVVLKHGTSLIGKHTFGCLIGGYFYQKNGVVAANYLDNIPTVVTSESLKTIKITGSSNNFTGKVKFVTVLGISFWDDGKERKHSGWGSKLEMVGPNTARWVLTEDEWVSAIDGATGEYTFGGPPPPEGFSVPTNVILTKVK
jgi:hypothetical protein